MTENTYTAWYDQLELAFQNPNGSDMQALLALIRSSGLNKLQSFELRQASRAVLQAYGAGLSEAGRWLLGRLQNAGYQPGYPDYLGLPVLAPCEEPACTEPSQVRQTFRLTGEMIAHLLDLPDLQDHPKRNNLEKRAQAYIEATHEFTFSMLPMNPPSRETITFSLVPESGVPDELIFIRTLQSSELIFGASNLLASRALAWMSYGEALKVVENLHWIHGLAGMVTPLLGLLAPMSQESWHQIRPLIMTPSAIQSPYFHHLNAQLGELERILQHPRVKVSHERYLPLAQELLSESLESFQSWEKGHRNIAVKYNRTSSGEKSEGVQWLERRPPAFSQQK